jgi:pimeloyl-ACP methyl ester carboxylesterase
MGGYVALYLARNNPEMVNRIFTLATKFDWTPESAMRESQLLDPVRIEENLPAFARLLKERHSVALWQSVLDLTVKMMMEMGSNPPLLPDDLGKIESRTLIGVGDRDRMVSLEETINVYRLLKGSQLSVFPSTAHPLEAVDPERLAGEIKLFFK